MRLPKGTPLYENLNTSFVQWEGLVAELQAGLFTGYVQVSAWEYEGFLLLDTGRVLQAMEETPAGRQYGPAAAQNIAARAHAKDGALHVFRLSDELVQFFAGMGRDELVHKDLASDFVSLDRLVTKLESEKHTGYIEIRIPARSETAMLFFREGVILTGVLADGDQGVSGPEALGRVLQAISGTNAFFTVYRSDLAQAYEGGAALEGGLAREELIGFWQDVLKTLETRVDRLTLGGVFSAAFKRACIEQSNAYPFLDPFAGEFEYRGGRITLQDGLSADVSRGLADGLRTALGHLHQSGRLPNGALDAAWKDLRERHADRMARLGLDHDLESLG